MNRPNQVVSVVIGSTTYYACGLKRSVSGKYKVRLTPVVENACRFWNAQPARAEVWAKGFKDAAIQLLSEA